MSYQRRNSFTHMVSIDPRCQLHIFNGLTGNFGANSLTPQCSWAVTHEKGFFSPFLPLLLPGTEEEQFCSEGVLHPLSLLQSSSLAARLSLLRACVNHSNLGSPAVCSDQLTKVTKLHRPYPVLLLFLLLPLLFHFLADGAKQSPIPHCTEPSFCQSYRQPGFVCVLMMWVHMYFFVCR